MKFLQYFEGLAINRYYKINYEHPQVLCYPESDVADIIGEKFQSYFTEESIGRIFFTPCDKNGARAKRKLEFKFLNYNHRKNNFALYPGETVFSGVFQGCSMAYCKKGEHKIIAHISVYKETKKAWDSFTALPDCADVLDFAPVDVCECKYEFSSSNVFGIYAAITNDLQPISFLFEHPDIFGSGHSIEPGCDATIYRLKDIIVASPGGRHACLAQP